jgi:hypothetical protein
VWVHRPERVRIKSAELTASINVPVFNPQLTNQPHDLLYVERTAASPNREHPKKNSIVRDPTKTRGFRKSSD